MSAQKCPILVPSKRSVANDERMTFRVPRRTKAAYMALRDQGVDVNEMVRGLLDETLERIERQGFKLGDHKR